MSNLLVIIFGIILIVCILKFVKGCIKSLIASVVLTLLVWWLAKAGFFLSLMSILGQIHN